MASTEYKDYYSILGLTKTATAEEIKKTFRKLARQYHPDLNPGDKKAEARFKEINEAHEVLSDPEKRQKYDQFGKYWQNAPDPGARYGGGFPRGGTTTDVGFDFSQYSGFDEFINELLGRANTPGGSRTGTYTQRPPSADPFASTANSGFNNQGLDRETSLRLTFSEAFRGTKKTFSINSETIDVTIPAGTKSGSRIRLRGKGNFNSLSQQRGDLYLNVELIAHDFFSFDGDNLCCELPITPDEAVLGAEVEVPTPDGNVTLKVPPGIRSGQSMRLRGKGWSSTKGGRGDLFVKITISTPPNITQTEREYYEKIRSIRTYNPRSQLKNSSL